ncbi:hypothetical protein K503DRAFT_774026, partial [Rhizopogon vinicolor AM-OR11-026]
REGDECDLGLGRPRIPLDLPVRPNSAEHFEDKSALRTLKKCQSIFRDQSKDVENVRRN